MVQTKRVLTYKKFQAWLHSKKDRQIVGQPDRTMCCPIAIFFYEMYGTRDVFVGGKGFYINNQASRCPLWARRFIQQVDQLKCKNVTAQRARRILAEINP